MTPRERLAQALRAHGLDPDHYLKSEAEIERERVVARNARPARKSVIEWLLEHPTDGKR